MSNTNFNPILLNFPDSIDSERLIIRAPRPGDGTLTNQAVKESLAELAPWMPWAQTAPTIEESETQIRQSAIRFAERTDLQLLLFKRDTGSLIGSSGLHRINWETRKFEIGYWVHSAYAGQGYITEAVHAVTQFAVKEFGANRIEIRCDARNTNSANVAKRAGFVLEGTLRGDSIGVDGTIRDTCVFSKVRGQEF
ncbi:GNAT family N-acetyltransferase [Paenibacillus sp. FSL H7-0326]|uniref:GNAT family N-acetyltransferase n=1 Tax=Paenibacillus sp. FSL H7-0326 TaxID=1921144 RepID=UPI00096E0D6D|nr:GNAT family N-acetyltransferase [Paenibacillus sp. FSL H7-0326]OMC72252.1 GNAT family N-acetyltransferase [Paenibacillus sp. FSL H7-0326]